MTGYLWRIKKHTFHLIFFSSHNILKMKFADKTLQIKIALGYFIILIAIGCTVPILLWEKQRIKDIDADNNGLHDIRREIETVHRHITELSMRGESVISWNDTDYAKYHLLRLSTDSLLKAMRIHCSSFVRPGQVDTLRRLLADKETHLLHIMETLRQQEKADSLLSNRLPLAVRQATHSHEVTRKRKGIAGWLGGKQTVQLPASSGPLNRLNKELIAMQQERTRNLDSYTDSLRRKNRELNGRLIELVSRLDNQAEDAFRQRGKRMEEMRTESFWLLAGVITVAVTLLLGCLYIIRRDLRQRNRMVRQNMDMLEMRKKIILTLSHDIRGPLNAIGGSAELAMDTREKKRRDSYLKNILLLCKHILHLLNNLLDVYRLNEAKETRNDVPFRLSTLLDRIVSGMNCVVNNKGLLFTHEFKGTDVKVTGDVDRIEQIIDNLLGNALKFTERGTISFTAAYAGGTLTMEVSDTGIGMDEEQLERIFTPFERGTTHVEGFGLGLPITKGLVRLLNGTISVTSRPGEGSVFRVCLPLPETTENTETEPDINIIPTGLPARIIAIDDDPLQLEVVREMLERSGVSCQAFREVREVVTAMRGTKFDLLLTDIQMPGTNGFDLLKLLRNSDIGNSRTIPVVAMTARGDKEKSALLQQGFNGCVYKPFSKGELLNCLSSILEVQGKEEVKTAVDFDSLTAGATNKNKILETFIQELESNTAQLEEALKANDRKRMRDILHRIWPMLEMAQAEEPLKPYRKLLYEGKEEGETGKLTAGAIGYLKRVIAEAVIRKRK